jgi:CRP/FNR family transcriptional regulator, cyclic AMP receptor protein
LKFLSIDRSREARIINQLNEVPLFREFGNHERGEILKCSELVEFSRDEIIVRQGEISPEFFVLLSGEASVIVTSYQQGEFYDVGSVSRGEIIGEISALLKEPRTASVMAADTCQLLRFRDENFLRLFEKIPSFGFFLSRELARRLMEVMGSRNELIAENSPETVTIEQTDLSRMRSFMTGYYTNAIKSVIKKNQMITRKKFPRYRADFSISGEEQQKWFQLFDVKESECLTPFTYLSISGTMLLMKAVSDMEINFKTLRHIKSEMSFNAEGRIPKCDSKYAIQSELNDMIALRENRAVLIIKTFVYDQEMFLMSTHKDYFIVLEIDPAYLEALTSVKDFGKHDPEEFRNADMQQSRLAITHQHDVIYHKRIDIP